MTEYWFARRYPLGHARGTMAPVHWKGWLAMLTYALGLTGALFTLAYFYRQMQTMEGVLAFVLIIFVFTVWYLSVRRAHGDRVRTVADFEGGKPRV